MYEIKKIEVENKQKTKTLEKNNEIKINYLRSIKQMSLARLTKEKEGTNEENQELKRKNHHRLQRN